MGLTATGKELDLCRGESVSRGDLYNNERGNALPRDKRCFFCRYLGERQVFTGKRQGRDQLEVYISKEGKIVFFSNSNDPALINPTGKPLSIVQPGMVCLVGLKTCSDAIALLVLEEPEEYRCFQHRESVNRSLEVNNG